ncbi:MAG: hypothetical protein LBD07_04345 [Spirochaetaceae bacterium]|jgi:hypothetical protein|nr:hypothetical protein [Spirochaetaceae bacterium]
MNLRIFIPLLLVVSSQAFPLDTSVSGISDDSLLRTRLAETLFTEPPAAVLGVKPFVERLDTGERVQIRVERGRNNDFSIILAREINGAFTGWAQGSFVLTRNIQDGSVSRIRIFLRSDPYTYIQFRPLNETKSEMDVIVYDAILSQSLPISASFKRLLTMPLNDALNMAGPRFPRRYFEPDPENYTIVRSLISKIRQRLPEIEFDNDGAIDENGAYVLINNLQPQGTKHGLNCSGFAKWLTDGLIRPLTGKRLAITPLKEPYGERGTSFTESFERTRDPFFGLDWVRNLAAAAGTAFKSADFGVLEEIEVRRYPFQAVLMRNGRNSTARYYPGFLQNAGFGMEGIQPLLYTLAIDEPGFIFLGALNNQGGNPPLRTYFHIVALAPYFDEKKVFHVAVFESAEETSFNSFRVRYPSHYISLCRIPAAAAFDP